MKPRGFFITFEGIDGAGKTAQLRRLVRYLRRSGHQVCATREPGGTRVGERIREILVAKGKAPARLKASRGASAGSGQREILAPMAELVLMYAARAQHLAEVIRPALERGEIVVSDRYNDSSFAYQGHGRRLGEATVREIDRVVCGSTRPDLTLVLDLDPRLALSRALRRDVHRGSKAGRFEAEGLRLQQRVRAGYRALARREPGRVRLVAADRPHAEVETEIRKLVEERLRARERSRRLPFISAQRERAQGVAQITEKKKEKNEPKGKSQNAGVKALKGGFQDD